MNAKIFKAFLLISLTGYLIAGCNTQQLKDFKERETAKIKIDMSANDVIEILGEPKAVFDGPDNSGSNFVFAYCLTDTGGTNGDEMFYIWLQDNAVKNTTRDQNSRIGQCYEFFRKPAWKSSFATERLLLEKDTTPARHKTYINNQIDVTPIYQPRRPFGVWP